MKTSLSVSAIVLFGAFAVGYLLGFHTGGESSWAANRNPSDPQVSPATGKPTKSKSANALASQTGTRENSGTRDSNSAFISLPDLLKKANDLIRASDLSNPASGLKLVSLLNGIPAKEIPAALARIEELHWPDEAKGISHMILLWRLAETNGPEAIAYAEEKMTVNEPMINAGIMSAWAEYAPAEAWSHYLGHAAKDPSLNDRNPFLASLFSVFASQDQEAAFQRLTDLKSPQDRSLALNSIVQGAGRDEASQLRLLKDLSALPDPDERNDARSKLLGKIARDNLEKAMAIVRSLLPQECPGAAEAVAISLMETNPRQGAAFLLENQDPQDPGGAYTTIISNWGRKEPTEAGAWLNEQPQGPHLDNARSIFVRQLLDTSPSTAFAWAASISSESNQIDSLSLAYSQWSKQDATAAEAALIATGLPAENLEAIRNPRKR